MIDSKKTRVCLQVKIKHQEGMSHIQHKANDFFSILDINIIYAGGKLFEVPFKQ